MLDMLRSAMNAIERAPCVVPLGMDPKIRFAALAGLGSKYLAVGSPMSVGLIEFGGNDAELIECHRLLFGELEFLRSEDLGIEEAMAADIVCLHATAEFDPTWIADATHLNIRDSPRHSAGMTQLSEACALTYLNAQSAGSGQAHGLLVDVICGRISGRVGEEITALVA